MKSRALSISVVLAALAVGAYWYWSPVLAVRSLHSAAKAQDADTFNNYVDYPRLRESLKGQVSALLTERMVKEEPSSNNEYARAGAALGNMLGLALVDRFVDAMVRPEVVMRAMQNASMQPAKNPAPASSTEQDSVDWTTERKGVDKYIVYGGKKGAPSTDRVGVVLERSGFAQWKVTEIRLPAKL